MLNLRSDELEYVAHIKGFRGLIADESGSVIGSLGAFIVRIPFPFDQPKVIARLPSNWRRQLGSRHSLAQRLLRLDLYRMLQTLGGALIATSSEGILRWEQGRDQCRVVFSDFEGRRPISLAKDRDGRLYFGEYFSNQERKPVRVFVSDDDGLTWSECFRFPQGSIRHVHGLVFDPWLNKIWVMTGDYGDEAILGLASPGFSDFEKVKQGTQQTRVCDGICRPDAFYFCTDTPLEQNHVYKLDRRTKAVESLAKIQNSVLFMGQACGGMFASTIVEPSAANTSNSVHIWHSSDESTWREILNAQRDRWSLRFFGYPTASFAAGDIDCPFGFINFRGVRGLDGDCVVLKRK